MTSAGVTCPGLESSPFQKVRKGLSTQRNPIMLLVLFSAPAFLVSAYLAFLCYRQACYRQAIFLAFFSGLMLVFTLGVLGAGLYSWQAFQGEMPTLF